MIPRCCYKYQEFSARNLSYEYVSSIHTVMITLYNEECNGVDVNLINNFIYHEYTKKI